MYDATLAETAVDGWKKIFTWFARYLAS